MTIAIINPFIYGTRSISYQTSSGSTANASSYTFSSLAFGPASPARHVIVAISAADDGGATITFTSVTIGGVSATAVSGASSGTSRKIALYIAAVPTGATGDVSFGTTVGCERAGVSVWAAYNLTSATATDTAATSGASSDVSVDMQTGDVGVAAGLLASSDVGLTTYSGMTERYDVQIEGDFSNSAGDHTATSTETPKTVTLSATLSGSSPSLNAVAAVWR